jgi:hypothetical protein
VTAKSWPQRETSYTREEHNTVAVRRLRCCRRRGQPVMNAVSPPTCLMVAVVRRCII